MGEMLMRSMFIAQLSKKCPFVIATNLDPAGGNATWKIPNTAPYATYSLRALVYTNVTVNGKVTPDPIATGVSVGYFQVSSLEIFALHCLSPSLHPIEA